MITAAPNIAQVLGEIHNTEKKDERKTRVVNMKIASSEPVPGIIYYNELYTVIYPL